MVVDNPQGAEALKPTFPNANPETVPGGFDQAGAAEDNSITDPAALDDTVAVAADAAEPPVLEPPKRAVDSQPRPRKRWPWAVAGGAAVTAIAITVAAISGGDSNTKKAVSDPSEETANTPGSTTAPVTTGETATQFAPSELLPTIEKSPEEIAAAHIKLQLLMENNMSGDLMPYVFYDPNPVNDAYVRETLGLIHEIRESRGSFGPAGVYLDGSDAIESITAVRIPSDNPLGDDLSIDVVERDKVIQWEPAQNAFVEYVQRIHYRDVLRQKIVGGRTNWTQYSHTQLEDSVDLSSRTVGRTEADALHEESFKQLEAIEKELGIKYMAAPEPN